MSRAFGDKSLKIHLSSEPHVIVEMIGDDAEFIILASDGLWKVIFNKQDKTLFFMLKNEIIIIFYTKIHAFSALIIFIKIIEGNDKPRSS